MMDNTKEEESPKALNGPKSREQKRKEDTKDMKNIFNRKMKSMV